MIDERRKREPFHLATPVTRAVIPRQLCPIPFRRYRL
jgi:hypothetical protein